MRIGICVCGHMCVVLTCVFGVYMWCVCWHICMCVVCVVCGMYGVCVCMVGVYVGMCASVCVWCVSAHRRQNTETELTT